MTTTSNNTTTVTTAKPTSTNVTTGNVTTTVSTTIATTASSSIVLGELLGIVIYCASAVALLCLLLVLVAALYSTFSSRNVVTHYSGDKEEAVTLLKEEKRRSCERKTKARNHEYQQLRHSETDSTSDDDAENGVMYFDRKGNLISLVNPNYGRHSPMMIESKADDEENIHYYMSIYNELAYQAMSEPMDSWEIPKVIKVNTQEVTLKEPEYDN
ncbi:envelope glycoprotein UL132 [Cercopithecine betaherpesvirus 5]|uniref:Envelope glycoprotein UL132 n=1 Tax=Simian cytomegalovirus (strain Colburn) TaxID=50292 RepID=G8XU16_SCMVC|nr:envelope glycoprotein UL132 [Cercopithecine betaherpesvirus 5]